MMKMKFYKNIVLIILALGLIVGEGSQHSVAVHAADYGISNPVVSNGISTWDTIYFGNYYQNNTSKKEPIRWKVLSVNGDDAFLLSEKVLDYAQYNTKNKAITWEKCTLRKWLNTTFWNTAFSDSEKSAIKTTKVINKNSYGINGGKNTNDKVFILSTEEAKNKTFGFNPVYSTESKTRATEYTTFSNNSYDELFDKISDNVDGYYGGTQIGNWLRSVGAKSKMAANFTIYGEVSTEGDEVNEINGICPALHLDLKTAVWTKGDKITAKIGSTKAKAEYVTIPIVGKATKKKSSTKLSLKFKKCTESKKYEIQISKKNSFKKKNILMTATTKKAKVVINNKKLKGKKKLYVRVRSYRKNSYNGKLVAREWSDAKKVIITK